MPAKEGQALAPPGLPIAQRQHTSAWQRWKKQRRKTANICSGLVRGPALTEGKRLETRGLKVRPSLLTATHHNVEISSAPRGVRVVTLSSPPCNTAQGVLPPVSHSDWLTSVKMGVQVAFAWLGPLRRGLHIDNSTHARPHALRWHSGVLASKSSDSNATNGGQVAFAWHLGPL